MGQSGPMRIPAPGDALPWRGDGRHGRPRRPDRSRRQRMPLVRDGRPRKRWRYAGVYGEDLMLCAGLVSVAGRAAGVLGGLGPARGRAARAHAPRARSRARAARSSLPDGAVRVRDRGVAIDLALEPAGDVVEVVSRHGGSTIWTRKRPVVARGTVVLDGRRTAVAAPGLVDDSAGWHARRTAWDWCRGRRAGGRRAGGGVEPRRGRARRAGAQRADGVGRRRRAGGGAGRVRRGPRHRRRPALRRRGRAPPPRPRGASASSRASTASRSARSPARCPAGSRWRTAGVSWSAIAHAGERREAGTQRPIGPAEGGEPWPPRWPRCAA